MLNLPVRAMVRVTPPGRCGEIRTWERCVQLLSIRSAKETSKSAAGSCPPPCCFQLVQSPPPLVCLPAFGDGSSPKKIDSLGLRWGLRCGKLGLALVAPCGCGSPNGRTVWHPVIKHQSLLVDNLHFPEWRTPPKP